MRNLFLLFIFLANPVWAQWTSKVGINLPPLIGSSLEVTSEFSNREWYAVTVDFGYTFNTHFRGFYDDKVWDGYKDLRTSGVYGRLGFRLYTREFGPSQKVRFYLNPLLVVSNYSQSARFFDVMSTPPFEEGEPVRVQGTVLVPGLRLGFTRVLNRRFMLDFGVQKTLNPPRNNLIGLRKYNYQPGVGSTNVTPWLDYLQGYFSFKFIF